MTPALQNGFRRRFSMSTPVLAQLAAFDDFWSVPPPLQNGLRRRFPMSTPGLAQLAALGVFLSVPPALQKGLIFGSTVFASDTTALADPRCIYVPNCRKSALEIPFPRLMSKPSVRTSIDLEAVYSKCYTRKAPRKGWAKQRSFLNQAGCLGVSEHHHM